MMFQRRGPAVGLLLALVILGGLITGVYLAYQAGFSSGFGQGTVVGAQAAQSDNSSPVVPGQRGYGPGYSPYGYGPGYGAWGMRPHFGFFPPFLGLCLVGILFWVIIGGFFRARWWGRHHYGHHGHGPWGWGPGPRPNEPGAGQQPGEPSQASQNQQADDPTI
jgi:hypothetical protein